MSLKTLARPCGTAVLMVALFLNCACAQESPDSAHPTVQLPAELDRVLRDYEQAWENKDAAGLARLFAGDGFVLSSGRPPVRGRENIKKRYEGKGGPLVLRALAYATEGSVGFIIGAYGRPDEDADAGKFTLTLVKNDADRWLIMSDMDNGNSR